MIKRSAEFSDNHIPWNVNSVGVCWEISPAILEVIESFDNPLMCDYWDRATKWLRSKRWSLLALAVLVGLPTVVTWIEMLRTMLKWFEIEKL